MKLKSISSVLFVLSMGVWIVCCAPDYKNISSANGRRAILEEADNFLSVGNCESAIEILTPLIQSSHADYEAYISWASAHACKGGINFPTLLAGLKDIGTGGIWGTIVKANFSIGPQDGKVEALLDTNDILLRTAQPLGSTAASQRTSEANMMMVFTHLNLIGTIIGPLGQADRSTGLKSTSISGRGEASDECAVQIAFFYIKDSLAYVGGGSAIESVSSKIDEACAALPGGICPSNGIYESCLNSAALQAAGQLLINVIDGQWN